MDTLQLLEELREHAVDRPRTVMGPLTWGLNKHEIDMLISKVRASLPSELKAASQTVREKDRILEGAQEDAAKLAELAKREAERLVAEAHAEADRILEQARIQQDRMVSDSEILKLAKAQSEEIRNAADRDAVQTRRGADKYAFDVLTQLETVVGKVMTTIERGKQEMRPAEPNPLANMPVREREKVRA